MADAIGSSKKPIELDRNKSVDIVIDFQSVHHALFRLFARTSKTKPWEEVKRASSDTVVTLSHARAKSGLLCEFIFFRAQSKFRAAVVVSQGDAKNVVDVTAPDTAGFVSTEVFFV